MGTVLSFLYATPISSSDPTLRQVPGNNGFPGHHQYCRGQKSFLTQISVDSPRKKQTVCGMERNLSHFTDSFCSDNHPHRQKQTYKQRKFGCFGQGFIQRGTCQGVHVPDADCGQG